MLKSTSNCCVPTASGQFFALLTLGLVWGLASLPLAAGAWPIIQESGAQQDDWEFSAADDEFFEAKIRPILAERCFECHGPEEKDPAGGLQLASRSALLTGGETGPAVVPGDPVESLLIQAINYDDIYEMPPDSKLPDEEIELLSQWVKMGAPWPNGAAELSPITKKFDLAERRAAHWCWQPIQNPSVPALEASWGRDSIDAFVLEKLRTVGLEPSPTADKASLIRRLYFDLIGLPPTADEVAEFVADQSPDAYERLVDRLLQSPHFGEHWARHWMDLIRYAETYGHEFDYPLDHAYQYRDYLIRAFNADLPYDDFVREHIAGDLLQPQRKNPDHGFDESILATGFWYLGEATHGPVDVRGDEAGRIDNQIDVFGKTFLALTVACARCHDHMFDAISAEDYYALSGFLQSSRRQLAMSDYDGKINDAVEQLIAQNQQADQELDEVRRRLAASDSETIDRYWVAAVDYILKTPPRPKRDHQRFEGESFLEAKPTGGKVIAQSLNAFESFSWSGNQQLWWIEGKSGDRLSLTFHVETAGRFELVADFTTAVDYARGSILIDGESIGEPIEFFTKSLGKTGPKVLTTREFAAGDHTLEIVIDGAHPDAKPAHMIGLDYFEVRPEAAEVQNRWAAKIAEVAASHEVKPESLAKYIAALDDPALNDATHPLHWLRLLQATPADGWQQRLTSVKSKIDELSQRSKNSYDQSELFESFSDESLPGWFESGWAFDAISDDRWRIDPSISTDRVVAVPGTFSSSRIGRPLYGVLRSPTFTLQSKFIHYRICGKDVQVKVVIDGFTLDVHNALLFNGATLGVNSPDGFTWLVQGQDVSNYIGHRAHLEIIDHSAGTVCVDEIRFSDQPQMFSPPSAFGSEFLADDGRDSEPGDVGRFLAERLRKELAAESPTPDGAMLLDWLIRWRIGGDDLAANAEDSGLPQQLDQLRAALHAKEKWMQENRIPAPVFAQAIADGTGENEFIFVRGNHRTLGPEAPREMLTALRHENLDLSDADGSGRLHLADSLVSPTNPLVSRVIVNRLWHHLFGRGIVESTDNFGVLGETPSHPELLDHLAMSFVRNGWSIKSMLKRIVLTDTYRQSSVARPDAAEIDPDNQWLHRASIRRLNAESIRDAILTVSGQLDRTLYGPSVPIHLTEFMQGRGRPGSSGPLDGNGRRSVYIEVRRNFLSPMMLAFDTPVPFNSIGRRSVSNVPSQALMLLNNPFIVEQADHWATHLLSSVADEEQRIQQIYLQAYARPPKPEELELGRKFVATQAKLLESQGNDAAASEQLAWRDYCHVIWNAKEFYFLH